MFLGECYNLWVKLKILVVDRGFVMMVCRFWVFWVDGGLDIGCLVSEFGLGEMYFCMIFFFGFLIFEVCLLVVMVFYIFIRSRCIVGICCKVNVGI